MVVDLSFVTGRFQQIGLICWNATKRIAGTSPGDCAFIAVHTAVVPHLKEKRTVAETIAALDALGATNAKALVNRVFVIRIFDERSPYCGRGAQLILRAGIQFVGFRLEVASAELAV